MLAPSNNFYVIIMYYTMGKITTKSFAICVKLILSYKFLAMFFFLHTRSPLHCIAHILHSAFILRGIRLAMLVSHILSPSTMCSLKPLCRLYRAMFCIVHVLLALLSLAMLAVHKLGLSPSTDLLAILALHKLGPSTTQCFALF